MKVSVRGIWAVHEVAYKLVTMFDSLAESGVDSVTNVNLYFQIFKEGRPIQFRSPDGVATELLELVPTRILTKRSFASQHALATELDHRAYLDRLRSEVARLEDMLEREKAQEES